MDVPAAIASDIALSRQNVTLSVIKSTADQQQALAEIIDQSARSAPVSNSRGGHFSALA